MSSNKVINNPTLSSVMDNSKNSATFIVEPLRGGYGMTLGNSLRRVLLSSIQGAAIVAFRVDGVGHEFTTIQGVREDVVDISLNVKQIRLKTFTEKPQTLRLSKKGGGVVTAGDIAKNADVEVVNPEQIVAIIDDAKASIDMELLVEPGIGYQTTDDRDNSDLPAGFIAVDSLYSPVTRVRYKVESTRVGRDTDYDKLSLTIDTDGSISPRDAFEQAAAILTNQYKALSGSTEVVTVDITASSSASDSSGEEDALSRPIEELGLTARTTNALVNNDIITISDLVSLSESDLRDLKGFGSKALDEVVEKLSEMEF
ncbi:MAG TPA: DNA-directed RNA polymerase subunit alpha [Candidatus Saccharibacteria bacterium]|jgi:DNA-directed RNA polymerase subunit alpha|nr:DNA-directed RNA polymerase subunit alpha [Candidatus Saccharibacteria bacterium]